MIRACFLSVVLILSAQIAQAERRVALVIGNSDYEHASRLINPQNDAKAIAGKLGQLGFEVFLHENLSGQAFRIALGGFAEEALHSDLAVVYYAGHGIEMGGANYLIPIDAEMASESTAQFEAISLESILTTVRNAGMLGLVMLDACRDNPFASSMARKDKKRAISRGLSAISLEGEGGLLVSFAAQAGDTADDGDGQHSPYTEALLSLLGEPDVEVGALFQKVTKAVKDKTSGRQKPMYRIQPPEDLVYLVPRDSSSQPQPAAVALTEPVETNPLIAFLNAVQSAQRAPLENFISRYPTHAKTPDAKKLLLNLVEQEFWATTQSQDTINGYETYLLAFSEGRFVAQAHARKQALQLATAPKPQPIQTPTPAAPQSTASIRPSFDCTRASTRVEHAICNDSNLAHQDRTLASAFGAARADIPASQQRLWLKLRDATCTTGSTRCVSSVTQERINALNARHGQNTQSPSYECNRATTVVEISICRHGPLALQDRELVRYYKRAESRSGINQRNWIQSRERNCGTGNSSTTALCIARITAQRIDIGR
jgi:uncharacterized caspase-like protein/uncharacterized protein